MRVWPRFLQDPLLLFSKDPELYVTVWKQMKYGLRHQPKETVQQSFRTLKQAEMGKR